MTFLWRHTLPDGTLSTQEFLLRDIPPEIELRFRRRHSRFGRKFRTYEYFSDLIDYAIVGWTGVMARDSADDVRTWPAPCDRRNKTHLSPHVLVAILNELDRRMKLAAKGPIVSPTGLQVLANGLS